MAAVITLDIAVVFICLSQKFNRKARPNKRPTQLQLTITGGNKLKLTEQAQASVKEFLEDGTEVANEGTITFTVADTSVATIDDKGLITPVAAGTTTVTAKDESNGLTETKSITVEAVVEPGKAVKLVLTISDPFPAGAPAATEENSGDAEQVS